MRVRNATSITDALNGADGAQSTEASTPSEKKCRLLCDPARLPAPPRPKTKRHEECEEPPEVKRELREYFWKQKFRKPSKTRRKD